MTVPIRISIRQKRLALTFVPVGSSDQAFRVSVTATMPPRLGTLEYRDFISIVTITVLPLVHLLNTVWSFLTYNGSVCTCECK